MKYLVEFENSYSQKREIGRAATSERAHQIISQFLKDHNYKSYYWQTSVVSEQTICIDVGSWSEFFYITKL